MIFVKKLFVLSVVLILLLPVISEIQENEDMQQPLLGKATQAPSQGTDITNLLPMILGVIGIVIVVVFIAVKIK